MRRDTQGIIRKCFVGHYGADPWRLVSGATPAHHLGGAGSVTTLTTDSFAHVTER